MTPELVAESPLPTRHGPFRLIVFTMPDDARTYDAAAAMLRALGVDSVRLLTNNPAKVAALETLGVAVSARVPILVAAQPHSVAYLDAKRDRMSHALPAREPTLRSPLPPESRIVGDGR